MAHDEKIKSRAHLARILPALRRKGMTVGLTNGVFDLVHAGHVAYLAQARRLCDVLIVSLNTDASVRAYKSACRPLVPLRARQEVVAALADVDFVTSHGERRMRAALTALKPDFYIKGGDYDVAQLTSRGVVEAYGGRAVVLPLKKGLSTTALIARAAEAAYQEGRYAAFEERARAPAAYLDRDGVILRAVPHLHTPDRVALAPGAAEGMARLAAAGLRLVVVTNQPGIGMGYFTVEDFFRVNSRMLTLLAREGVRVEGVYFCPHSLAFGCACRKPGIALLERAAAEQALTKEGSVLFGDREVDMRTARAFGIPGALVGPGDSAAARRLAAFRGATLAEAAARVTGRSRRSRRTAPVAGTPS